MNKLDLPLIIEPAMLEPLLEESHLLVVDMTKPSTYAQIHIPGAVYLDYGQIIGCCLNLPCWRNASLTSALTTQSMLLPMMTRAAARPADCSGHWRLWGTLDSLC